MVRSPDPSIGHDPGDSALERLNGPTLPGRGAHTGTRGGKHDPGACNQATSVHRQPFTYESFSATFPSRTRNTSTPRT